MKTDFVLRSVFSLLQIYVGTRVPPFSDNLQSPPLQSSLTPLLPSIPTNFPPITAEPSKLTIIKNEEDCREAENNFHYYFIYDFFKRDTIQELVDGWGELVSLQIKTCSMVKNHLKAFGYTEAFLNQTICSGQ